MSGIEARVSDILTQRFGIPAGLIAEGQPLNKLGIDSLVAVELTLVLRKALGVAVEPGEITSDHTPAEIAELVAAKGASVQ